MEARQSTLDRAKISYRFRIDTKRDDQYCHHQNAYQCGRQSLGQLGYQIDNRHGQRDQAHHGVKRLSCHPMQRPIRAQNLEMPKLCQKDDDRQAVNKAQHDRMRHHPDELAELGRSK